MKAQNFLMATFILTSSTLIAKLLGAVYRIPLTYILGAQGLGIYQLVFPLYSLLLVITSSGLPNAISKIISYKIAKKEPFNIKKFLKCCLIFFSMISLFFSILVIILSKNIATLQGNHLSYLGFIGIAPAIIIVANLCIFRGTFQGLKNMTPTSISLIVEQTVKLISGLIFAYLLMPYGIEYGVLGAILGVTLSEAVALVILIIQYYITINKNNFFNKSYNNFENKSLFNNKIKPNSSLIDNMKINNDIFENCPKAQSKHNKIKSKNLSEPSLSLNNYIKIDNSIKKTNATINKNYNKNNYVDFTYKVYLKEIFKTALPIMASNFIIPLALFIDSFLIINLLNSAGILENAIDLYGLLTGVVNSLINLPIVITFAVSTCILPNVTSYYANRNYKKINHYSSSALKIVYLFALPCFVVFLMLSKEILLFLYAKGISSQQIEIASFMLKLSSISIVYVSILQVSTSLLQSINLSKIPVYSLILGVIVKLILTIVLVQIPSINIYGAIIASISCYTIAVIINMYYIRKNVQLNLTLLKHLIAPFIAITLMTISIFSMRNLFTFTNYVSLPLIISIAFIIYLFVLLLFKSIEIDNFSLIRKLKAKFKK